MEKKKRWNHLDGSRADVDDLEELQIGERELAHHVLALARALGQNLLEEACSNERSKNPRQSREELGHE